MIPGRRFLALALGLLVCFSSSLPAHGSRSSYLIINRAPNFGNAQWLLIWIDGEKFDPLAFGHDFEMPISPGRHVIVVEQSNKTWQTLPNHFPINVEPGRTYEFTAFLYQDYRVYLEPPHYVYFSPLDR